MTDSDGESNRLLLEVLNYGTMRFVAYHASNGFVFTNLTR